MKLGLISSAWLGSPIGTAEGIRLTKEIGFDTIDIFADPLEIDVRERKLIRDTCGEVNIPVVSTVCCALGIADFNLPVRRFHVERARRISISPTNWRAESSCAQRVHLAQRSHRAHGTGRRTLRAGRSRGGPELEIALELEPFHLSLINDLPKMIRFLDDVGHPAVKANMDVSHLALAHTKPEDVTKLSGRIAHAHSSDCDGKKHGDLPPGRGVVDFPPYLKALKDARFEGTVSIELEYSPEPDKIAEWVTEAYRETDRLMQSLGIRN